MAPEGFFIAEAPPPAEQLTFSKKASPANELLGKSILFNWPVVGWAVGVIKDRNHDARQFRKVRDLNCQALTLTLRPSPTPTIPMTGGW